MNEMAVNVISKELLPDENILWAGMPRSKKDTYYAITSRRTIIVRASGGKRKIRTVDISKIKGEYFTVKEDKTGTICLGLRPHRVSRFSNPILDEVTGLSETGAIIFHDIEDCENVMKIYLDVRYPKA